MSSIVDPVQAIASFLLCINVIGLVALVVYCLSYSSVSVFIMKYKDLRDFIRQLEANGDLVRISHPIDTKLEMTEIADRTLRAGGPALLFENPKGFDTPVLMNLFGTPERVALGMGQSSVSALREVGKLLAYLKEPEPPKGLKDLWEKLPVFKQVLNMPAKEVRKAPCQANVILSLIHI